MPEGTRPRVLEVDRHLWAIVSDVPETAYGESELSRGLQDIEWVGERAVSHEHVVEHFLSASSVLPMQLFTMFTSDERVVAHVRRNLPRIKRVLQRVERKVEWGVRLTWDEKAAPAPKGSARKSAGPRAPAVTGTAYLKGKRDSRDAGRVQLAAARAEVAGVFRAISRQASEARRRKDLERATPGSRLLLDAAFLVKSAKTVAFRSAVRKHARALRSSGVSVSLTGPWPPYNFIGR